MSEVVVESETGADGRWGDYFDGGMGADAIARLPEREALMMSLYYSEGLNLREIAGVLEVTESRVSQLHGQAIARLRGKLSAWMG